MNMCQCHAGMLTSVLVKKKKKTEVTKAFENSFHKNFTVELRLG